MAGMMQPLMRHKQRLMNLPRAKRIRWMLTAAALLVMLILPVPLRVAGAARVLPDRRRQVDSEVQGRVARVYVREGDRVDAGQVLAVLDDTDYRIGEEARSPKMARMEQTRLGPWPGPPTPSQTAPVGIARRAGAWKTRLASTQIRARRPDCGDPAH